MELGARKQKIVAAVVDAYIRTGEPVGSKLLAEMLEHTVSSATIRNDMADLAAAGYLAQPHTSAGRVPTAAAFRLYVDGLRCSLAEEDGRAIEDELSSVSGDPERLLGRASELLADATGMAAAVATPDRKEVRIRRVELLSTGAQSAAVLLMTDNGALRSRVCRLELGCEPEELQHLAERLNAEFGGKPLSEIGVAPVQALFGESGLRFLPILTAFLELVQETAAAEVRLSGQLNLLQHPDIPMERARSLLTFLSHRELLAGMLTAHAGGLRVVLGSESPRRELEGSSIIVTRYGADNSGGTLCLIGPMRMDYAQVIPRLQHVAHTVSMLLNKGGF
ncbi:MAG: heat-inducible transcription repressor HrcA [Clostridia bacterium]|nr:heat-inducible transcription repressor HrcA [Clostridia bacterium]